MRALIMAGFAGVACVMAASALASSPVDDAVTDRKAIFKNMGKPFKELHGIAPGDIAAKRATVVADAQLIKSLANQPWTKFGPETAKTTVKTEALAVIWTDAAGFRAAQTKFIGAVNALDAVAANGAPDVVAQKIADVGASCGGCHKVYRAK
ncbi:MAG: cytochrome c [Caulobacteraceae bacterium]|nr:cytochrome c [Caulobacteraceae bacterium]